MFEKAIIHNILFDDDRKSNEQQCQQSFDNISNFRFKATRCQKQTFIYELTFSFVGIVELTTFTFSPFCHIPIENIIFNSVSFLLDYTFIITQIHSSNVYFISAYFCRQLFHRTYSNQNLLSCSRHSLCSKDSIGRFVALTRYPGNLSIVHYPAKFFPISLLESITSM